MKEATEKTKEEFKEIVARMWFIYTDAYNSYHIFLRLYKPKNEIEKQIIEHSPFFRNLRRNYLRLAILDIAKLLSESSNQYYSVKKWLKWLRNNYKSISWLENLGNHSLIDLYEKTDEVLNSQEMENVKTLRNQYIAHTDSDPDKTLNELNIKEEDFEAIFNHIEETLSTLNKELHDTDMPVLTKAPTSSLTTILHKLSEYKKLQSNAINNHLQNFSDQNRK